MIKITLIRNIKGKDLIKEYEQKYGSLEKLKKEYEKDGDMIMEIDIEDWEYFKDHPDENMNQKTILYNFEGLPSPDLNLLNLIKNKKPKSITELAKMMNKDAGNVTKQVNKLKEAGLIEIEEGNAKNIKIPVINYDKIEIAI